MNGTNTKKINMNRVNSSSLFHFTQKLDTLKKIIKNGLRYSFAYEQYPSSIVQSYLSPFEDINDDLKMANGVAIPMISFCDIPITRASEHIDRYGHYMIGLNKNNFSRAGDTCRTIPGYIRQILKMRLQDSALNMERLKEKFLRCLQIEIL